MLSSKPNTQFLHTSYSRRFVNSCPDTIDLDPPTRQRHRRKTISNLVEGRLTDRNRTILRIMCYPDQTTLLVGTRPGRYGTFGGPQALPDVRPMPDTYLRTTPQHTQQHAHRKSRAIFDDEILGSARTTRARVFTRHACHQAFLVYAPPVFSRSRHPHATNTRDPLWAQALR